MVVFAFVMSKAKALTWIGLRCNGKIKQFLKCAYFLKVALKCRASG